MKRQQIEAVLTQEDIDGILNFESLEPNDPLVYITEISDFVEWVKLVVRNRIRPAT